MTIVEVSPDLGSDEPAWRPLVTFHALESLPVTCRAAD